MLVSFFTNAEKQFLGGRTKSFAIVSLSTNIPCPSLANFCNSSIEERNSANIHVYYTLSPLPSTQDIIHVITFDYFRSFIPYIFNDGTNIDNNSIDRISACMTFTLTGNLGLAIETSDWAEFVNNAYNSWKYYINSVQ